MLHPVQVVHVLGMEVVLPIMGRVPSHPLHPGSMESTWSWCTNKEQVISDRSESRDEKKNSQLLQSPQSISPALPTHQGKLQFSIFPSYFTTVTSWRCTVIWQEFWSTSPYMWHVLLFINDNITGP
jgi:hypothetical protein